MLTYFPSSISRKAMTIYFVTLAMVSIVFMNKILPFYMMLFGIVEVCSFFYFSNDLTKRWRLLQPKVFVQKLFWIALIIRLVYAIFAYFFYDAMTGQPFMFHSADERVYYTMSQVWSQQGFEVFRNMVRGFGLGDSGEIYWTGFLCKVFGTYVLTARIGHCVLSAATCVLIYRIAKRHFGESTARMSAIFCMLMPNLIYYCGLHLKEADMVFVTVLFVDCIDAVLSEKRFDIKRIVLAVAAGFSLFTFRTALGAVGLISVMVAVVFIKGRLGSWWKRILLAVVVVASLTTTTVGDRIMREVDEIWEGKSGNINTININAERKGAAQYTKYVSGTLFAPFIFTIPLPGMVDNAGKENQQMIHGGVFVKCIMSGFTIYALFLLLLSGEWRKHVLPIAMMCGYLVVIAFSKFAFHERFHQPALPFELMFAAFGISQVGAKQLKWFDYWTVFIFVIVMGWSWIKRGG